jgi:hypothetical protein
MVSKEQNYEYVSYNDNSSKEEKRNDSNLLQRILQNVNDSAPNVNGMDNLSSFVSPRYVAKSRSRLPIYYKSMKSNKDLNAENYEMPWHSTKLEFDMTNNELYTSNADSVTTSANSLTVESLRYNTECDKNSCNMSESTSNDSSSACSDIDVVHACCVAYKAVHEGDLDIDVADRVNIIFESITSEFILIKHIRTGKCGYVPKICILNVNKFLNDIN